jgi:hypothetical protein
MATQVPHDPVPGQVLYSIPQGSRVLGISARLLWAFVQRGEVKTRRVGSRVLIHRRDLEKFALRDHATQAREESL